MTSVSEILGMVGGPPADRIALDRAGPAPAPDAGPDPSTPGGPRGALSGTVWAGFRVGDLVGTGGMGEVYRAVQLSVGRMVALKVLPAGTADDPALRLRLMAEARAAGRIRSPHVVAVHDAGEHGGRPWLAMEFIDGTTLADELAARTGTGRTFAPAEAAALGRQAALGLAAAHAEGLVHRDIKPGNLMIGADGRLRVTDFGLVRILGERTMTVTGMVLGTPLYLSPEQGRGLPADARADVYGLGVVLYEMLTLRPPFQGANADELVRMHNFVEPELPASLNPDVPQDLQAVVIRCLHKDPARRYPDATSLAADLDRLCRGMAPRSAAFAPGELSTGAAEAVSRLAGPRHRLVAAAVLAAILALGLGWWWWDARRGEIDGLRSRLAPLAVPAAIPATAAGDLARLGRLAGGDDPQVVQGLAKIEQVAALAADLDRFASSPALDRPSLGAARAALAALAGLVGPGGDPRQGSWTARIAEAADGLERLRARLAPALSGAADPTAPERAAIASDLAAFLRAAPADDRDLLAWRARLERIARRDAGLERRLARLDDPAPLTTAEAASLREALADYAAACPDAAALAGWRARLAAEAGELAGRGARLAQLLGQAQTGPAERQELEALRAWFAARNALAPDRERAIRDRLDAATAELAALRVRLAVLDAVRTLPPGAGGILDRYEALAGPGDADAVRWRRRYDEVRALQDRLAVLDRREPPPPGAADDLRRLSGLVGPTDPQAAAWAAKLAAVETLRGRLAASLDRAQPVPAGASADLGALAAAIGDDDGDVRRWSAKLAAVARMEDDAAAWEARAVLDDAACAEAQAAVAGRRALVGDDAVSRRREARIAELRGPSSPPAWAAAAGRDLNGPWAELRVGGQAQRLRWLPPIVVSAGSAADEPGHEADEAQVRVRLTHGRWIADSECSQGLYRVVTGRSPSRVDGVDHPVEQVSRDDAVEFCARLGAIAGCPARLPDEAEWEAAVRAGHPGTWAWLSETHAAVAVVHAATGGGHQAVGSGGANPLGLRHGLGNVWEWCRGGYGAPPVGGEVVDPVAVDGPLGVVRGGAWNEALAACRPANRAAVDPRTRSPCIGFRFVVDAGGGP